MMERVKHRWCSRAAGGVAGFVLSCIFGTAVIAGEQPTMHEGWNAILNEHVSDGGLVNYKALLKKPGPLNDYLDVLANTQASSLSREGKLAYWINAYNAFTVKLILDNYPITSIRKIEKPWKQKVWRAGGVNVSLDEIEHDILRKRFKEPRIHFAIVCASIGCPDLWNHAYTEKAIDKELTSAARKFIGSRKHVRVAEETNFVGRPATVLRVSSIFKWFRKDFIVSGKADIAAFVAKHADQKTAASIRAAENVKIKFLSYDWNINELKAQGKSR